MNNNHVADAGHTAKTALLQWLSEAAPVVLAKSPSINRRLVAPVLVTTLIASVALAACGAEEPSPEPAEARPDTQSAGRTDAETPRNAARNVVADATAPADDRQLVKANSTDSNGSSEPRQSSKSEPTGTPATSAATGQSEQTIPTVPTDEQVKQAEELYVEAELHLLNQRFHRATHALDQAIVINPDLVEAYTLRGFARTMVGDHPGAMQDFDMALDMDAENAGRAYAFRSYLHSEMENYEDALADAQRALETVNYENEFAWADASLAKFTAQYRSGDFSAIEYHDLQRRPSGSIHELNEKLAPYGLSRLYPQYADLNRSIETILEADTHLLLNPDDASSHYNRYNAHLELQWHAKALQDLDRIVELSKEEHQPKLYLQRARIWAQSGDYESLVQNAGDLDASRDIETSALLAVAYWNARDAQQATDAINAFDYSDPKALFQWNEDYPPTNADSLYPNDANEIAAHLAIKGTLLAAQGQLDEGLKYLNLPSCNDRIIAATAEDIPITWHPTRSGETALHIIASQLANSWFNAKRYGSPWTEMNQAKAMWEWCDYPDEFIADPEAGMWATMALPPHVNQPNPPFPTRVSYSTRTSHPNFFDPIVIASDNPSLHHYMAAWAQLGSSYSTAVDIMRDIDRAIALGSDNPDAHRIEAETHLAWALGWNPISRPGNDAWQAWREHHHDQAVDAYSIYESLASPERWEAARYHFTRGMLLGRMDRKEEAQSAYRQAFQHGFSEEAVKQALMELNR